MTRFGQTWLKASVANYMKRQALLVGEYHGTLVTLADHDIVQQCTADHIPSGTRLIFTVDTGMHSSGWFKNPDFERCLHLSLSFRYPANGQPLPHNHPLAVEWCELFFGKDIRYLSIEPPGSPDGLACDVWHYRLFCDENWQPIIPRGEVYSTEFTEKGWKSWNEMHGDAYKQAVEVAQ